MKLDKVVADVRRQLPFSILNGSNGNETKPTMSTPYEFFGLSVSSTDRMAMKPND